MYTQLALVALLASRVGTATFSTDNSDLSVDCAPGHAYESQFILAPHAAGEEPVEEEDLAYLPNDDSLLERRKEGRNQAKVAAGGGRQHRRPAGTNPVNGLPVPTRHTRPHGTNPINGLPVPNRRPKTGTNPVNGLPVHDKPAPTEKSPQTTHRQGTHNTRPASCPPKPNICIVPVKPPKGETTPKQTQAHKPMTPKPKPSPSPTTPPKKTPKGTGDGVIGRTKTK